MDWCHEWRLKIHGIQQSLGSRSLPKSSKTIECRWVFKTKCDSNGNIERYKVRLVANKYTKKGDIDYKKIFSPVSKQDSLRIILTLVAHYDLSLHQMYVKTFFLNVDLEWECLYGLTKEFRNWRKRSNSV